MQPRRSSALRCTSPRSCPTALAAAPLRECLWCSWQGLQRQCLWKFRQSNLPACATACAGLSTVLDRPAMRAGTVRGDAGAAQPTWRGSLGVRCSSAKLTRLQVPQSLVSLLHLRPRSVCHAVTTTCGQHFSRCARQQPSQASEAAQPACLNVAGSPRRTMRQRVHQGKLAHRQAGLGGARTQHMTGRRWLRRCRRARPPVTTGCTRTRRAGAAAAGRARALPGPRYLQGRCTSGEHRPGGRAAAAGRVLGLRPGGRGRAAGPPVRGPGAAAPRVAGPQAPARGRRDCGPAAPGTHGARGQPHEGAPLGARAALAVCASTARSARLCLRRAVRGWDAIKGLIARVLQGLLSARAAPGAGCHAADAAFRRQRPAHTGCRGRRRGSLRRRGRRRGGRRCS